MKKKITIISVVLVSLLVLVFVAFSVYIGIAVVEGSTQLVTNEETMGVSDTFWETYNMDYDKFCENYTIQKVELVSSFDGHTIPADLILASEQTENNKTVIMVHGLGGNRYTNYPVAETFLDKGYNVLTYDQRSSNENTAEKTTFGYWEKYDLIDCITYIESIAPEQIIGIWGTSFGGATTGLAMGYEDIDARVEFVILDCPVSSMEWMVTEEMKHMDIGIPVGYMTWCGNIANKMMLGFTYKDADASVAMKDVETPVLIINSKMDEVTPYFMGCDIYEAIQSENKHIWTVEDSAHTEMWLDYNEEYVSTVNEFIEKYE